MTSNQQNAVELARGILERRIPPGDLNDLQWELLLLASGVTGTAAAPPTVVSYLVLQNARSGEGYFAGPDELAAADGGMAAS
jgi:hypothetical protein